MPRGRIPQPRILNDLKGDPHKRRRHESEPTPPADRPACPQHLDEIARQEWDFITAQLDQMGLLSAADKTALELYCQAYARYRRAEAVVAKYGEVIVAPETKYPMVSPYVSVMNRNLDTCRRMLVEFGLTPAARSRMRVQQEGTVVASKWAKLVA
jgi:P27 family predicted phage terminase small subunit